MATADLTEITKSAQQQVLDGIEAAQSLALESFRSIVEATDNLVPAKLREIDVPGSDLLPEPGTAVKLTFDFAEELLARQRAFVEQLAETAGVKAATKASTKTK